VEIWAGDEHRVGLKPITRGVWAPKGERPIAYGHHRYQWLYVTGFVEPASGNTLWTIADGVAKEMFEAILADFAQAVGAGPGKRVVLLIDNAGWHGPENLAVPEGVRLVFQPAHSPELQPAEHLWELLDEPLVNVFFETIDDLSRSLAARCVALSTQQHMIQRNTAFHWWPETSPVN
jgi:transposase